MSNNKIVTGIANIQQPSKVCDNCCESKQPRKSYNTEISTRSSVALNLIHTDVCGPFEKVSIGGAHTLCPS